MGRGRDRYRYSIQYQKQISNGKNYHIEKFNHSNAVATYVQSTRTQRVLKIILTMLCWYSSDSSHRVLLDECLSARVSVLLQVFCIILYRLN